MLKFKEQLKDYSSQKTLALWGSADHLVQDTCLANEET